MASRLFVRSIQTTLSGYTISPAPTQYRNLVGTGFGASSNGISTILGAGLSASVHAANARFATAIPNYTGTAVGSYKITHGFQTVVPTDVFTKVRVHRATLSGTVLTIAATSEWSGESLTNKTTQRWEHYLDQVDLGTWASTNALIVEYAYRNAGASSITIQSTGGGYYQNAIYSPFETSAAFGYANQLQVGQRHYNYSQGGIRGTLRYLKQTTSVITSSGTATGTKGGSDFSGSVTGISTSSGTVAAGLQGYGGSSTGSSTSPGSANGSPNPPPQPDGGGASWYAFNRVYDQKQPEPQLVAFSGYTILAKSYSFATVRGVPGFTGLTDGTTTAAGSGYGGLGYYGAVQQLQLRVKHRAQGNARFDVRGNKELLLLMGEL